MVEKTQVNQGATSADGPNDAQMQQLGEQLANGEVSTEDMVNGQATDQSTNVSNGGDSSDAPGDTAGNADSNASSEDTGDKSEGDQQADTSTVSGFLSSKGVDYDALSNEYQENGGLSEESYKALEEAGFPKVMVDNYLAGQQASLQAFQNELFSMAGGEESQYMSMIEWAAENASETEIKSFNEALDKGGDYAKLAVQGMYAKYTSAEGSEPTLVEGNGNGETLDTFGDVSEVTAAMSDPRYGVNVAYTKEVEEKLGRSNVF